MRTFLPFSDFMKVAIVLSNTDLLNQYKDCMQLAKYIILEEPKPNKEYPVYNLWMGYEDLLTEYIWCIYDECRERDMTIYYDSATHDYLRKYYSKPRYLPEWYNDKEFHISERSLLLFISLFRYLEFSYTYSNLIPPKDVNYSDFVEESLQNPFNELSKEKLLSGRKLFSNGPYFANIKEVLTAKEEYLVYKLVFPAERPVLK